MAAEANISSLEISIIYKSQEIKKDNEEIVQLKDIFDNDTMIEVKRRQLDQYRLEAEQFRQMLLTNSNAMNQFKSNNKPLAEQATENPRKFVDSVAKMKEQENKLKIEKMKELVRSF